MTLGIINLFLPSRAILVLLPVFLFACGRYDSADILEVSGFIEAAQIRVGTRLNGTVMQLLLDEGDRVEKGNLLAVLDRPDLHKQLESAEASMLRAEARLADLRSGARMEEIKEAEAVHSQAMSGLRQVRQDTLRYAQLLRRNAAPERTVESINSQYDISRARVEQAKQRLALLRAGTRPHQIIAAQYELEQAKAILEVARINNSYVEIKAPGAGIIQSRNAEVGEVIPANFAMYFIIDPSDLWVRVYVPESDLPKVRVGSHAKITIDAFPAREFSGKVEFIAPEAEFTPRNVQTKKERVNLVFEVKVALENTEDILKPGLPADVNFILEESGNDSK